MCRNGEIGRKGKRNGKSIVVTPKKGIVGRDIYTHMREVEPGDVVLHLIDNKSIVEPHIAAGNLISHSKVCQALWKVQHKNSAGRLHTISHNQ